MQIHEITTIHKKKTRKRVGRGGKKGTYSGRGIKGQKARAGRKLPPIIRELIKRYHKIRGYRDNVLRKEKPKVAIGIKTIEEKFNDGELITPKTLIKKGIVSKIKGKIPVVKILNNGEITKKITVKGCKLSQAAKEKIEKAGGKVLEVNN